MFEPSWLLFHTEEMVSGSTEACSLNQKRKHWTFVVPKAVLPKRGVLESLHSEVVWIP